MKVLFIGGTGEISYSCVEAAIRGGHNVTMFNRGRSRRPDGARRIVGDIRDDTAYQSLADQGFDVACQFRVFTPDEAMRDTRVFADKVQQYIFISSASAYQKPLPHHVVTEDTPLGNPFAAYSQNKADAEAVFMRAHHNCGFPVTIIRPSQTHRFNFPGTFVAGDIWAWRMLHGKPIFVHGDGQSLWTLTHADDFARAFVGLLGHERTLGQAYHITRDQAHTWDRIFTTIADCLGVTPKVDYIASQTLSRYHPDWGWPLIGDKANSSIFDNAKIRQLMPNWHCQVSMEEGLARSTKHVSARMKYFMPDPAIDTLIDQAILDQSRIGADS
jgi:nucleoside-diphosphate-sugar epimerase